MKSDFGRKNENAFPRYFLERQYGELKKWALKITNRNHEMAEDIVHDIYIRLYCRKNDFATVKDADAYLYTILKNEYISNLRKSQPEQISSVENEIADAVFFSTDPRKQFEVRDDLRAVCFYSCLRKETSISASILILRFFHGYSVDEISKILNTSRNTIDARLLAIRRELKVFFENHSVDQVEFAAFEKKQTREKILNPKDLVSELREIVFATKSNCCPTPENLREIYENSKNRFPREMLSHIVSCRECLEVINKMFCFPPLNERHPLEASSKSREKLKSNVMAAGARLVAIGLTLFNDFVFDLMFSSYQF